MQMDLRNYQEYLETATQPSGVTGASFAYWDGAELQSAVTGVRNSITGDPMTADTVMHIGSITKLFNAVLLLQLVDEGLLTLDDPIVKHIPELRIRDLTALQKITCAMLLNHTSGIDGDMFADHGPDQERIEDAIRRCAELNQVHEPGEAASYCNVGSVIAGYLVQKLTGVSWYTLVKRRIFEPLGMTHALADLTDLPHFRIGVGDVTDRATGQLVQTKRAFLPLSFAPAGATLMMTSSNLVTFGRALVNGGVGPNGERILLEASSSRMTRPTAELVLPAVQVGLGWMLLPNSVLTHGGSVAGGAARLYAHLPSGRVATVLINCDRKHAIASVLDPIVLSWSGMPMRQAPPSRQVSASIAPHRYLGLYESRLMRAEVTHNVDTLLFRMTWKVPVLDNSPTPESAALIPLHPCGDDAFVARALLPGFPDTEIRFVRPNPDGRMQFLATDGRLLPRTL